MKNIKKAKIILSILLVFTMLIGFTGCLNKTDIPAEENPAPVNVAEIIDNRVFLYPSKNENFRYNVYENYIKITEYIGNDTKVVIPSTIEGLPVYVVSQTTFTFNNYVDESGEKIERSKTPLYNVEEIIIEENIYKIESYAFDYLPSLKNVSLPESLRIIGEGAFENCVNLRSITIPKGVTTIPDNLCSSCETLLSVTIEGKDDVNIKSSSENNAVASAESNTENTSTERTIGINAFANCPNLRYAWIPKDITLIDETAFQNSMNSLTISGYAKGAGARYAASNLLDFVLLDKDEYTEIVVDIPDAISTTTLVSKLKEVDTQHVYQNFENPKKSISYSSDSKTLLISVNSSNNLKTLVPIQYAAGTLTFTRTADDISNTIIKGDKFWLENLIMIVCEEYGYDEKAVSEWLSSPKTDFSKYTLEKNGIEIKKDIAAIGDKEIEYYSTVKISLIDGISVFKKVETSTEKASNQTSSPEENTKKTDEATQNDKPAKNTSVNAETETNNNDSSDAVKPNGAILLFAGFAVVVIVVVLILVLSKKKK